MQRIKIACYLLGFSANLSAMSGIKLIEIEIAPISRVFNVI